MSKKNTGTSIKTWMVEVIMPPTIGAAIGFITSDPIEFGRQRHPPPCSVTAHKRLVQKTAS
jgi:hypothetical protein